jgi:hypothetical protein
MIPEAAVPQLRQHCRSLQIIVFSLTLGVAVFAVVAVAMSHQPLTWEVPTSVLGLVVVLMALTQIPAAIAVRLLMPLKPVSLASPKQASIQPTGDAAADRAISLAPSIMTRTIISGALLEGAAFLALFVVMTEGNGLLLVVAAIAGALLLLQFPTFLGFQNQIDSGLRRLDEQESEQHLRR